MRIALIAAGALAVACVGYTTYWYSAAREASARLHLWAEERRVDGWAVELGKPSVTGFPLRLDLSVHAPIIAGRGNKWRWEIPNFVASARPWALTDIRISFPGSHRLEINGMMAVLNLAHADGDLKIRSGKARLLLLRLAGVNWMQPGGITTSIDRLTLRAEDAVSINPRSGNPMTGKVIAVDARKVVLPKVWKPPVGSGLDRLSFDASVIGPLELSGLLPEALSRWNDAGGAIEFKSFTLNWEALSLRGDGALSLDDKLQPQGAITVEIRGIKEILDTLMASGVIDARTAFAAKVANRALSIGGRAVRLPVSLKNQRLYLGPVPLFRLKKIRWK
tara:strand:- start:1956 stop:2960 length:1005 start_codon:yes stop_codon:yes gene_type:complete